MGLGESNSTDARLSTGVYRSSSSATFTSTNCTDQGSFRSSQPRSSTIPCAYCSAALSSGARTLRSSSGPYALKEGPRVEGPEPLALASHLTSVNASAPTAGPWRHTTESGEDCPQIVSEPPRRKLS